MECAPRYKDPRPPSMLVGSQASQEVEIMKVNMLPHQQLPKF